MSKNNVSSKYCDNLNNMSKSLNVLKRFAEYIPEPLGSIIAEIPFSFKLGSEYDRSRKRITKFRKKKPEDQKEFVFRKFKKIVYHAYKNIPFYKHHYKREGFSPGDLRTFSDIKDVPIVRKRDLRSWSIEKRSYREIDRVEANTGGSSGRPLNFYFDKNSITREWAYLHEAWGQVGYDPTDIKMTLRGYSIGKSSYEYSAVSNEFRVNTYRKFSSMSGELINLIKRKNIKYIHGYPSAVYEFAEFCRSEAPGIASILSDSLNGILLGSEYPAPLYRNTIEEVFGTKSLSWFGHSERAIFAPERSTKFVYEPMQTYGLCEAVPTEDDDYRLVGTSYYNKASPFIRYDTGDRIGNVQKEEGILRGFKVTSGRVGEFIEDRANNRIPLTSLIFGRHHDIFKYAKFVQVRQNKPGHATLIITPMDGKIGNCSILWEDHFDDSNVDIDFDFELVSSPVRTDQGKVNLLL
jgi:phenylacetate-CoA ligase